MIARPHVFFELCTILSTANICLEVHGNGLRVDAPAGTLTPELVEAIRKFKPEILAMLCKRSPNAPDEAYSSARIIDSQCTNAADLDLEVANKLPSEDGPIESAAGYPSAREFEDLPAASTDQVAIDSGDSTANPRRLCRCNRCGSPDVRDVRIHDGQSLRRDCGHCHRFLGWPKWYGKIN